MIPDGDLRKFLFIAIPWNLRVTSTSVGCKIKIRDNGSSGVPQISGSTTGITVFNGETTDRKFDEPGNNNAPHAAEDIRISG